MSNTLLDNEFVKKIRTDLQKIDLSQSRIGLDKLPKVFLCGGPYRNTSPSFTQDRLPAFYYCSDAKKEKESIRYKLIKCFKETENDFFESQVKIADIWHFNEWYQEGNYKDLLTLEKDIASMSGLVVIIPESAGSIAELGSFVMIEKIKKKLLIFIEAQYTNKQSFIWNGIIKNFQQTFGRKVIKIQEDDKIADIQEDIQSHLIKIIDTLEGINHSKNFQKCDETHQAFFIYEMIGTYGALMDEEIKECIKAVDLNNYVTDERRKNLLFILEKFGWINKNQRISKFYYIPKNKQEIGKTKFIRIKGKEWSTKYFHLDALAFYRGGNNPYHKDRYKVIKDFVK